LQKSGKGLDKLKKSADFIGILVKSTLFETCIPVVADAVYIAMEVHMKCVRESFELSTAILELKDEARALRSLCERFQIIKARYYWYVLSTESFIQSMEQTNELYGADLISKDGRLSIDRLL
jgi:hypothetical protein